MQFCPCRGACVYVSVLNEAEVDMADLMRGPPLMMWQTNHVAPHLLTLFSP
jgi:hypothetical protein